MEVSLGELSPFGQLTWPEPVCVITFALVNGSHPKLTHNPLPPLCFFAIRNGDCHSQSIKLATDLVQVALRLLCSPKNCHDPWPLRSALCPDQRLGLELLLRGEETWELYKMSRHSGSGSSHRTSPPATSPPLFRTGHCLEWDPPLLHHLHTLWCGLRQMQRSSRVSSLNSSGPITHPCGDLMEREMEMVFLTFIDCGLLVRKSSSQLHMGVLIASGLNLLPGWCKDQRRWHPVWCGLANMQSNTGERQKKKKKRNTAAWLSLAFVVFVCIIQIGKDNTKYGECEWRSWPRQSARLCAEGMCRSADGGVE